jgi:hypothetical protein
MYSNRNFVIQTLSPVRCRLFVATFIALDANGRHPKSIFYAKSERPVWRASEKSRHDTAYKLGIDAYFLDSSEIVNQMRYAVATVQDDAHSHHVTHASGDFPMQAPSPQHSAKIIPFAPRPRLAAHGAVNADRTGVVAERRILPMTSFGSGWYHDAAIRADAKPKP